MQLFLRPYAFLLVLGFLAAAPCTHAQDSPLVKVGAFASQLKESSGLAMTPRGLFSLSDDGLPEIYLVDTADASILQTVVIRGLRFADKEALTYDGEYLYVGDFGNNKGHRRDLNIVKIRLADIASGPRVEVDGEVIAFHYPEQTTFDGKKKENAFDCEAMVALGDSLYLFTKQRNDHRTTAYALPKTPGEHAARKLSSFDSKGRITGAALSPDGNTLLLLGYQKKHQFPFLWKFSGFSGSDFFAGNAEHVLLTTFPLDWQMEAVTFVDEQMLFLSCEESDEVKAGLYRVSKSVIFE